MCVCVCISIFVYVWEMYARRPSSTLSLHLSPKDQLGSASECCTHWLEATHLCPQFPQMLVTKVCNHAWLFGGGGSNSSSHVCTADSVDTEPSWDTLVPRKVLLSLIVLQCGRPLANSSPLHTQCVLPSSRMCYLWSWYWADTATCTKTLEWLP